MAVSYKTRNVPKLLTAWVLNVVVFLGIVEGNLDSWKGETLRVLLSDTVTGHTAGWPFIGSLTLVSIFNGFFPRSVKERLVFWPADRPGSRAFSHFMSRDSTINEKVLLKHCGPLLSDPDEQNALWVTWLHEFDNDVRIRSAYILYLFARDWTTIAVTTLILASPVALWFSEAKVQGLCYAVVLVLQCLVARRLARIQGEQLVTSVMARKGSSLSVR